MSAIRYDVTFGYGAQDGYYYGPNGVVGYMHRGNDRPTPLNTPVSIQGTIIGYTGNTGLSGGPHLHTQSGKDEWVQNTVDPTSHEFKPGVVIHAGWGNAWGYFVIIKGTDGYYTCYAHLNSVEVQPGQKVGNMGVNKQDLSAIYKYGPLRRTRSSGEGENVYLGKSASFVLTDHAKSKEGKAKLATETTLRNSLAEARAKLETCERQAKKTKEIIKELETTLAKVKGGNKKQLDEANQKIEELAGELSKTQKELDEALERNEEIDNFVNRIKVWFKALFRR